MEVSAANSLFRPGSSGRDRSLDRQLQRRRENDIYFTYGGSRMDGPFGSGPELHEHSMMTAVHPERSAFSSNLVRSRSIDHDFVNSQASFLPQSLDFRSSDTLILDLQTKVAELNKECSVLQQDLDLTKDKLASSMNSIKTFWSPELKKERAMRKEESAKIFAVTEQLTTLQAENRKQSHHLLELENQVQSCQSIKGDTDAAHQAELQQEKEKNLKELLLLRKTVSEMKLRIDTQKQTLDSREESITKLMGMLHSKEAEVKNESFTQLELLRKECLEHQQTIKQLEDQSVVDQQNIKRLEEQNLTQQKNVKQLEDQKPIQQQAIQQLEERHRLEQQSNKHFEELCNSHQHTIKQMEERCSTHQQTIKQLEERCSTHQQTIKQLEERCEQQQQHANKQLDDHRNSHQHTIKQLQERCDQQQHTNKQLQEHCDQQQNANKQLEERCDQQQNANKQLQEHCDQQQEKVLQLEDLLAKKEESMGTMEKNLLDSGERKCAEYAEHIKVLESEIVTLRMSSQNLEKEFSQKEKRSYEEEQRLTEHAEKLEEENRAAHSQIMQLEQSAETLTSQLQQNFTEMEEVVLRNKDLSDQLQSQSRSAESSQRALEALREKNTVLESSLKECNQKMTEVESIIKTLHGEKLSAQEQAKRLEGTILEQKATIDRLSEDKYDQEAALLKSLKEEAQTCRGLREKLQVMEDQLGQTQKSLQELEALSSKDKEQFDVDKSSLRGELEQSEKQRQRAFGETDRLLKILEESELEKRSLDTQILDLQSHVKLYKQRFGDLRETSGNPASNGDDTQHKCLGAPPSSARVEELEEALKESIKITAQRELLMARQQDQLDLAEKQVEYLNEEIQCLRDTEASNCQRLQDLENQIAARDRQLQLFQGDRGKQMSELYNMKQEALSAAITEKDAHIALLEIAPNKKTENIEAVEQLTKEKISLQQQLKDLTEKQVKFLGLSETNRSSKDV